VDLELMRASALLESDPATAARLAGAILAHSPDEDAASLLLAAACRRLGDPATATKMLESLVQAHPNAPVMQLELGRSYAAAGRNAEALAALQRAVALDATLADAWKELATQRFRVGDVQGGDAAYLEFSRLAPNPPELTDALVARSEGRLDAAEALALQRLQDKPDDVEALHLLASIAIERDDSADAEKYLVACLEVAPGRAGARHELARLLQEQERRAEALPLIERLLAAEPRNVNHLCLKAQTLNHDDQNDEAMALINQVVADFPDVAQAWLALGNLRRELGEQAGAIDAYRRALAVQPESGEAYWALANLKTVPLTEEDRARMQELTANKGSSANRIPLEFALGKAFEDAGQFAESFKHYARGNDLRRGQKFYNPASTSAFVERCKLLYTEQFFADRAHMGSTRQDPIFVVGLPRSGSTLLEQILASHSQIEGTRELPYMPAIARSLVTRAGRSDDRPPNAVGNLSEAQISDLTAEYLGRAGAHRPLGKPRFVDKMLGNFSHVGLIQLMFPRAAIIDTRRHPLGCGLSCYKQLFHRGLNFSYDLEELGLYYRDYVELMAHIDRVLPGRVHRVHYEHLVADLEGEVRRLLEYCQLPFEPECLRFYATRRKVKTVSSEQVRRPIYSDGVDHWRNFEPWLGPMKGVLGDLIANYPLPDGQKKTAD
jgi:tetratricopeptide (TPR) repeat protein